MQKIDISQLTKHQKIELLEKVRNGEGQIIDGCFVSEIFHGIIFYDDAGRYFLDNDREIEVNETYVAKKNNEQGIILMPLRDAEADS